MGQKGQRAGWIRQMAMGGVLSERLHILGATIDEDVMSIEIDSTYGLKPCGDMVLIKRDKAASVTPGGLTLPEQARLPPQTGLVLAVGPGEKLPSGERSPCFVRPGQRVLFGAQFGTRVEGHEDLHIVREGAILAVQEDPNG